MPTVVTLSGSPNIRSRSEALLRRAAHLLESFGVTIKTFSLADFSAEALLYAHFDHPAVLRLQQAIADADGLVVSTPVYKSAYSGVLKVILDLLPERALARHAVLPLATGGSPAHMLAVDYALQPVLTALKARHILGGIYATDQELVWGENGELNIAEDVAARLNAAVARFITHLPNPGLVQLDPHVLNTQVRIGGISV